MIKSDSIIAKKEKQCCEQKKENPYRGIKRHIMDDRGYDSKCDEDGRSDEESSADCIFYVGGYSCEVMIRENKYFLADKSSVFERMFQGSIPEGNTVKITDVEPEAFMLMLKYLHEEPYCFLSKEMAMDVIHVAEKYALLELKQKCEEFLLPERIEEVWLVADCAFLYNSTTLQMAVRDLLSQYTYEFISVDNFLTISEDLVLEVVQLQFVTGVTELQIFNRVVQWAKYQLRREGVLFCDPKILRQKLEKFLKHIRFLNMSSEDFSLGPAKSGVLNSEELQTISNLSSVQEDQEADEVEAEAEVEGKVKEKRIPDTTLCMNTQPRVVMSEPPQKKIHPTIQVLAYSPADNTMLSFRKSKLREEVKLAKRAHLLTITVPSQIVTSDTCSYYHEDLQVSVHISGSSYDSYGRSNVISSMNYGYGVFKGIVQYSQEIHIPVVSSVDITMFSAGNSSLLKYTVEIKFNSSGFYPWHSPRSFGACDLMAQQDHSSGLIMGYKFMLM